MDTFYSEFTSFMEDLEKRLGSLGLTLQSYPIDHICYRVSTIEEYKDYIEMFRANSILCTTKFFHEREFHLFILKQPLKYKDLEIYYLEFAQPGGSDVYDRGFQHIEFHTNTPIESLVSDKELLFEGKHGDEVYIKWEDKVSLKVTPKPLVTKSLVDPEAVIEILQK